MGSIKFIGLWTALLAVPWSAKAGVFDRYMGTYDVINISTQGSSACPLKKAEIFRETIDGVEVLQLQAVSTDKNGNCSLDRRVSLSHAGSKSITCKEASHSIQCQEGADFQDVLASTKDRIVSLLIMNSSIDNPSETWILMRKK